MNFITVTGVFSYAGDVELRGDSVAMLRIAELLRGKAGKRTKIGLHYSDSEPTPYDGFLKFLDIEIRAEASRVIAVREGDTLHIVGSDGMIKILAENIEMLVDDVRRSGISEKHLHVEYHPDHYYLDSSSVPLILTVIQPE